MVQWLYENRSEGCSVVAMRNAINDGNLKLVWCLHQAGSDCDIVTALRSNPSGRWKFTEWAYIHHRKEFESTVAVHLSVGT
jgi:hypothetical protein